MEVPKIYTEERTASKEWFLENWMLTCRIKLDPLPQSFTKLIPSGSKVSVKPAVKKWFEDSTDPREYIFNRTPFERELTSTLDLINLKFLP